MSRLQIDINKLPTAKFVAGAARKIVVPGMNGTTIYQAFQYFDALKLQERAAAATYNFLMALPPTLLFLFSLLPYVPFKNVDRSIYNIIRIITPNRSIYLSIRAVIHDIMATPHHALASYGFLMVLFFSSNGVMGLLRCFDKTHQFYVKRNAVMRRWAAIKLTVMLLLASLLALSLLIFQSKNLNTTLTLSGGNQILVKTVSFCIISLLLFTSFSLIYTFGPSLNHKFRFVSVGSVSAAAASVIVTALFFYLVNNFLNYNKVYGSIGSLIAFMVWVWLNTNIILLGYEMNVINLKKQLAAPPKV